MTDPKRLMTDEGFGADLLRAATADAPSTRARARVAGALGVTAGVVTTASASTAAAHVTVLKVVAASVVALGVTAGATIAARPWSTPTGTPPVPTAASSAPTTRARAGSRADEIPPPDVVPENAVSEETAPDAGAGPSSTVSARSGSARVPDAPPPAAPSDLAAEVRALDAAKSSLNQGDAATALEALDRYDHDFPQGSLRTEADVLRVDALVAAGHRAAAKRLAHAVLARDPASAHARHLRSIVADD